MRQNTFRNYSKLLYQFGILAGCVYHCCSDVSPLGFLVEETKQAMETEFRRFNMAGLRVPEATKLADVQQQAFAVISRYAEKMDALKTKIVQRGKEKTQSENREPQDSDDNSAENLSDTKRWESSGNLATFLGLAGNKPHLENLPKSTLEIPVQVDLVFLGFQGDGHNNLSIHPDEFEKWFQHLVGALPHITLESIRPRTFLPETGAEKSGHLKIQPSDVQTKLETFPLPWDPHPHQRKGRVHREITYRYSFHVVEIAEEVLPLIEDFIQAKVRLSSSEVGTDGAGYISAWHMEELLESLTAVLTEERIEMLGDAGDNPFRFFKESEEDFIGGIETQGPPAAFTLYILNPKTQQSFQNTQSYGYRWGLSWADLSAVANQEEVVAKARAVARKLAARALQDLKEKESEKDTKIAKPRNFGVPQTRVNNPSKLVAGGGRIGWRNLNEATHVWATQQRAQTTKFQRQTLEEEVMMMLSSDRLSAAQQSLMHQILTHNRGPFDVDACVSEMWLAGNGRFGWIDLGAGPYSWGPLVGGTGTKTKNDPQRAPPPAVQPRKLRNTTNTDPALISSLAFEKQLSHHLSYVTRKRVRAESLADQMNCGLKASGGRWQGSRMQAVAKEKHEEIRAVTCLQLSEQLEMLGELQADLDSYTELKKNLLSQFGNGVDGDKYRQALQGFDQAHIHMLELVRDLLSPFTESDQEAEIADDDKPFHFFLANLAAYVSKLAEQILTPPLAIIPLEAGPSARLPWIPDQLAVTLYIINTRTQADAATDSSTGGFDVTWFKEELLSLGLGRIVFTSQEMSLTDDPALATAYAASIKEYTRPDGNGGTTHGKYLDSALLRSFLSLQDTLSDEENRVRTKHVPVFLFSVMESPPMYIDEFYKARALEDMVIIIQSQQYVSSTLLESNGRAVYRSSHNPLTPALQAMANFLGGLMPAHIKFTPGTHELSQDWFWCVGESPLNPLAMYPKFTPSDKDKVHRSQAIQVLDASIELTHQALQVLARTQISKINIDHLFTSNYTLSKLQSEFDSIHSIQNQILMYLDHSRYDKARSLLNNLLDASQRVLQASEELFLIIHPSYCNLKIESTGSSDIKILLGAICMLVLSFILFIYVASQKQKPGSKRSKPKIN